ncbi:MAG: YibE/F family protein [Anaerolineales bacterium]
MRNKTLRWFFVLTLSAVAAFFSWPYFTDVQVPDLGLTSLGSETIRAEVLATIEEGTIDMGPQTQPYQIVGIRVLEGDYRDDVFQIDYGRRQLRSDDYRLTPGTQLLVSISETPDGRVNAYFVDFVRTTPLLLLAAAFAVAILMISRWKGLRSLVSMAFSLFVIVAYIIPHILAGENPLAVSIMGSAILLGVTLYLTYGWTIKTHAASLGMIAALLLTGLLSAFFVNFARLTGMGDENAMFLSQFMQMGIDLRGLLLGGMIIGALGVMDDLVTTQASAVVELHEANPALQARQLYRAAMRIGQDHVAATVNTLVLAYAGASLPLFLMFSLARGDYSDLVNYSFIAEEIVRTLVGSLGLVAAVPLTTIIAIAFVLRIAPLAWARRVLGPTGEMGHGH